MALVNDSVVGFSNYLDDSRDMASIKPSSEIDALYLLKEYQNRGIGLALIKESLNRVSKNTIILFALEENTIAINFYKRIGFEFTGHKVIQPVVRGYLIELEMVLKRGESDF